MEALSIIIDNLYYSIIEREIADYYDLGSPDNSSIPPESVENSNEKCILIGTKRSGEFNIRITKQSSGKYWLFVSPVGKITNN
ncbi:MAG TPA: hypothetical protein VIK86_04620 [Candidatus Paceibacterota bacterium]